MNKLIHRNLGAFRLLLIDYDYNYNIDFISVGVLLTHKIPITFHNLDNILSSRKDEQGKKSMISIEAIPDICLWRTILSIKRTRNENLLRVDT